MEEDNTLYEGGADWGPTASNYEESGPLMPDLSIESSGTNIINDFEKIHTMIQYHKPTSNGDEGIKQTANVIQKAYDEFGPDKAMESLKTVYAPDKIMFNPEKLKPEEVDMNTLIQRENENKARLRDLLGDGEEQDALYTPAPPKSQEVLTHIMDEENPRKVGYDPANNTWTPYMFEHKAGPKKGQWEVDVGYGRLVGMYPTQEAASKARNNKDNIYSDEQMTSFMDKYLLTSSSYLQKKVGKEVYKDIPKSIKKGLSAMMYQIGDNIIGDSKTSFKNMTKALNSRDWNKVIEEAKDSVWYKSQTPARAKRVIKLMEEGIKGE